MTERVLFFPWGWGGAAGYTARCLALAQHLAAAGDEIAFADCGINRLVREAGFPVLPSEPEAPRPPERYTVPPYLPFADVERVFAVAAGYHRAERVERRLAGDVAAIDAYRPTLVVIDMNPTAALAARSAGVPVVSLADADFVTPEPNGWMPWSEVAPRALLPHPSSLPVLDAVSRRLDLGPVARAEHLLWGDVTLIPSLPELEPIVGPLHRGVLHHVGPLYWNPTVPAGTPVPPATELPKVYVTIGSGGMVGREALQNVLDACAGRPWSVFVSTGFAFAGELTVPENVILAGFTGLDGPLDWADVVVCHGGYSTVLATLTHGKPLVILPFMSEQEMNGRQLVENIGTGLLLRTSRTTGQGRLSFRDRYSGPSSEAVVGPADIRRGIADVLGDPAMARRAGQWGARLRSRRESTDLVALAHAAVHARARAEAAS